MSTGQRVTTDHEPGVCERLETHRQTATNSATVADQVRDPERPPAYYRGKADGLQLALRIVGAADD
jgi:hypothetical protein